MALTVELICGGLVLHCVVRALPRAVTTCLQRVLAECVLGLPQSYRLGTCMKRGVHASHPSAVPLCCNR
jgi:hypothetical protein